MFMIWTIFDDTIEIWKMCLVEIGMIALETPKVQ
jgi:hypothetical protein